MKRKAEVKTLEILFEMKEPSVSVPGKRCSKNMQQIYRRTPMQKCDLDMGALL